MALFGKSKAKTEDEAVRVSFILTFEVDGEEPFEIDVEGKIIVGSSSQASVCLEEFDLAPKHYIFKQQEDMLTLNYLGPDSQSKIGKQKLNNGKMYILEDGDILSCDGLNISVEKVEHALESTEDQEEENDDEFAEDTMIASNKSALEDLEKEPPPPDDFDEVTVARLIATQTGESERPEPKKLKEAAPLPPASKVDEIDFGDEPKKSKATPAKPSRTRTSPPAVKQNNKRKTAHFVGPRYNPPGLIGRLFSLALTVAIIQTALLKAPQTTVTEWQEKISTLVAPWTPKLLEHIPVEGINEILTPELISLALFFLGSWAIIELVMAILFGGPLGLLLQGFRDQGNFIGKRIKSIFRLILVLLFLPLFIVFLPILWGARPLTDVLSATKWDAPKTARHVIGKFLFIPVIIFALYFSGDILELSHTKTLVTTALTHSEVKEEISPWDFSSWSNWRILPKSDLKGWRLKKENVSELHFEKRVITHYLSFWKQLQSHHPLMRFMQPSLYEWLEGQDVAITNETIKEALALLNGTLLFSPEKMDMVLKTFGPDLRAPLKARAELLDNLNQLKASEIVIVGSTKNPQLLLEWNTKEEEQFVVALIPLLTKNAEAYVLTGPLAAREEANQLIQFFFHKKTPQSWDSSLTSEAQSFALIWPVAQAPEAWTAEQLDGLYSLLRKLGGEALGSKDYPYSEDFLNFLVTFNKEIGSKIPDLKAFLDKAIQAVEQRDPTFFIGEL